MTDPVRPVAPREDEKTQCAKMLIELAFLLPRGTNVAEHSAARQLVRYVDAVRANAAAPVPCAASPADLLKEMLACSHEKRSGGNDYILCDHCGLMWDYQRETWQDALLNLLRATGEGARDAATGLPAVPVPPVAAPEESPAVAVSLDPHRLLWELETQIRELTARLEVAREAYGKTFARLRGEATVRVEE